MSTAVTILDAPVEMLPAHIHTFFDEEKNVLERNTTPTLGIKGKVWTVSLNGESEVLTKTDADGDEVPAPVMRVVILDYGKRRGRAYYEGSYDPNNTAKPDCWSDDGNLPAKQVAEPRAASCASCPLSVKGSKITDDGKQSVACAQHRILVVVPANKLDFPALRLKLAITSDYDGQSPELAAKGWVAFSQLLDLMRARNVHHTAAMVVKMKFDTSAAYPKVIFSPDRWLSQQELAQVAPRAKSDEVKLLVSGAMVGDASPETAVAAAPAPRAVAAPAPKAAATPKPTPKPAPAPVMDDDEEEMPVPRKGAPKAKVVVDDDDEEEVVIQTPPKATKKAPAKPAPAPVADEDDEEEAPAPKKGKKAASAPPAAAVATEVPDDVAELLDGWDD